MTGHPFIEISAFIFGLLGTLMLAFPTRWSAWGFVAYLASNFGWLVYSWEHALWLLFAQQVAFTLSSLLGIWLQLGRPWLSRLGVRFGDIYDPS